MSESTALKFSSDQLFAGDVGIVDHAAAVIKGVSMIQTGEAEGHALTVDGETIKQLQACAKKKGKVPVQLDHGSGISATVGYVTNFRVDKDKLRADLHLLQTHEETKTLLERAETMSELFGLSVAFKGPPKGVPIGGGKMGARCEKLLSVDLVTRPAANEGLFSVPVDKDKKDMAKEITKEVIPTAAATEPTLADIAAQLKDISGRLDDHEQFIIGAKGSQDPTLEDLDQMSDDELSTLGVTRAEVDAAITEALAEAGIGDPNAESVAKGGEAEGELEPAGAAASGAEIGAAETFASLSKRIIQLENKLKAKELAEVKSAEAIEFAAIEEKVMTLATQRDGFKEKNITLEAEVKALRLAVKTGTRPVKAGVDTGVRMFGSNGAGQLHEFQVRVKALVTEGKTEAQAITLAQKESPAMHADWVQSMQKKDSAEVTV